MTKQLDLLLVNPGGRHAVYQGLQDADITAIETPVWCGLIAGFVRKHGFTVGIYDQNAVNDVWAVEPRLIAVVCYGQQPSASTQTMPAAYACVRKIKELYPQQKVIMVGGHVAALPERTLEESGAGHVATGEGCHTILDLLQGKKLEDCRGIGYHGYAKFETTEVPCYFETHPAPNVDVAEMEMAWDLFDPSKYRCHNWQVLGMGWPRSPYAALYTSLGCPWKCAFCCIQAPFREGDRLVPIQRRKLLDIKGEGPDAVANSYRLWPPDKIGQRVAHLHHDRGVKVFKVADEMFVLNKRHVAGVCDAITACITNPADALNIWAYARVDTANDEALLAKMRSAGFRWLCLGIESASESVRDGVDKGYAQEKIVKCVERIKAAGIHVLANYIFGLPDDTLESMQQTLAMAMELNTPWSNFYSCMAYPGAKLWDEHSECHNLPWSAFSQHSRDCTPLATKTLTSAQVLEFRDQAFQTYFTSARYLGMLVREFGTKAVKEVQAMTAHKLERILLCEQQPVSV